VTIKKTGQGPQLPPREPGQGGLNKSGKNPRASGVPIPESEVGKEVAAAFEAKATDVLHHDSFDDQPATGAERHIEDLMREARGRTSQVRSMEKLLVKTAEKVTTEIAAQLKELETFKADTLLHANPEAFPELSEQVFKRRRKVARLRRRLLGIHRRLKLSGSLAASMGAVSDLGRLSRAADAVGKLKGLDQASAIVHTLPKLSPAGHISRVDVPEDVDRDDLARVIAHGVPGAALARAAQVLAGQLPPSVELSETEQALLHDPHPTRRAATTAAQLSQAFVES
jgi:hypothetical protein